MPRLISQQSSNSTEREEDLRQGTGLRIVGSYTLLKSAQTSGNLTLQWIVGFMSLHSHFAGGDPNNAIPASEAKGLILYHILRER
jgi:hypothetical protein